jgi:hypothetical protein
MPSYAEQLTLAISLAGQLNVVLGHLATQPDDLLGLFAADIPKVRNNLVAVRSKLAAAAAAVGAAAAVEAAPAPTSIPASLNFVRELLGRLNWILAYSPRTRNDAVELLAYEALREASNFAALAGFKLGLFMSNEHSIAERLQTRPSVGTDVVQLRGRCARNGCRPRKED